MRHLALLISSTLILASAHADNYETGTELFRSGSFADAIPHFEEAIRERPSWFAPYMLQGQCLLKMGRYDKALLQFQEALQLDPPDNFKNGITYHMGQAYMGMKRYEEAAAVFGDLVVNAPANRRHGLQINIASCFLALGKAHMDKDNAKAVSYFEKSADAFDAALGLAAKDRETQREAAFQRAWARFRVAELTDTPAGLQRAATELNGYLREDSEARRAYRFLIDLDFLMVKKGYRVDAAYSGALEHLDGYLAQWPDDARMVHFKGQAFQGLKRYDQAVRQFERATTLEPDNGSYFFSLGSSLMAADQHKRAIEALNRARALGEKENADLYFYAATCYTEQKRGCFVDDIPLIEKAIEISSDGVAAVPAGDKARLRDLIARQENNLAILRDNIETDRANHAAVLENVRNITVTITGNTNKLQIAKERYITTPTEELEANIAELEAIIIEDKERLAREKEQMKSFIRDAEQCGGNESYPKLKEMRAILKAG